MKKVTHLLLLLFVFNAYHSLSQNSNYWQQHVDYVMDIDVNVDTYRYQGKQKLTYTNNSLDELNRVFYHLYFNAFQPGSEMDARVKSLKDPDRRMVNNLGTRENPNYESRISKLSADEIGYIKVASLTHNGQDVNYQVSGTVLEVDLSQVIKPGESAVFEMEYEAQIPVQIRRSGRNNAEGIVLSMTQWFPKIAEYDENGWHADPYIQREFYSVWGNYDVTIHIDRNYIVAGTGYLQNPNEIGYGYETGEVNRPSGDKLSWHFVAPNVHDFTWAADPDYLHDTLEMEDGPTLHFFYQNDPEIIDNWKALQPKTAELMTYFSENIGKYPYDQYSVIQGGDGGMEYAMCTLITGKRKFNSLFGVTAHELAHSWFQFLLATNESVNEWMDEGFTNYIDALATNEIFEQNKVNPNASSYRSYFRIVEAGIEQPLTTHADRYNFNSAYSMAAYRKGAIFLSQLGYIIGKEALEQTLKNYFSQWAFKHPDPYDFIRVAEKTSGLELDWYLIDWAQTTNTIDYSIENVEIKNSEATITLERVGVMPMPLDIEVVYKNGNVQRYNIPLRIMRGHKKVNDSINILDDWAWAYSEYSFSIDNNGSEIQSITIDPKGFMADINRDNNTYSANK